MRPSTIVHVFTLFALAIVSPAVAFPSSDATPAVPSLQARAPAPSSSFQKRALRQKPLTPEETISRHLCPMPMRACAIDAQSSPTTLTEWIQEGFECVDPQEDLASCGGCGMVDVKYDCSAIKGAQAVSCIVGECRVDSCRLGYTLALDGKSCIRTR